MGESPGQRAQRAAQQAADKAFQAQQDLIADINKKAYGYETKALEAIPSLGLLSGTSPIDYVKGTRQQFQDYTNVLQNKYEKELKDLDPNILYSPSMERAGKTLREAVDEFTQRTGDVSRKTSADLYRTLAVGPRVAEQLASSAATNLTLDPDIMEMAARPRVTPPKSAQDLGYADYMRYNV